MLSENFTIEKLKEATWRLKILNTIYVFVGREVYGKLRKEFPTGNPLTIYGIPITKVDRRHKQWRKLKKNEAYVIELPRINPDIL